MKWMDLPRMKVRERRRVYTPVFTRTVLLSEKEIKKHRRVGMEEWEFLDVLNEEFALYQKVEL